MSNVYAKIIKHFTYVSFIIVLIFRCVGFIQGVFFLNRIFFFAFASGTLPLLYMQLCNAHAHCTYYFETKKVAIFPAIQC